MGQHRGAGRLKRRTGRRRGDGPTKVKPKKRPSPGAPRSSGRAPSGVPARPPRQDLRGLAAVRGEGLDGLDGERTFRPTAGKPGRVARGPSVPSGPSIGDAVHARGPRDRGARRSDARASVAAPMQTKPVRPAPTPEEIADQRLPRLKSYVPDDEVDWAKYGYAHPDAWSGLERGRLWARGHGRLSDSIYVANLSTGEAVRIQLDYSRRLGIYVVMEVDEYGVLRVHSEERYTEFVEKRAKRAAEEAAERARKRNRLIWDLAKVVLGVALACLVVFFIWKQAEKRVYGTGPQVVDEVSEDTEAEPSDADDAEFDRESDEIVPAGGEAVE